MMRNPSFKEFNFARCLLFCTLLTLIIRSTVAIWPFSDNNVETPTLKFYPKPTEADEGSTFIYYKLTDNKTSQKYIDSINNFLENYNENWNDENAVICDYNTRAPPGKFCVFERRMLKSCTSKSDFGFRQGTPCIFLTLSKVDNWEPITHSDINVRNVSNHQSNKIFQDYIHVSCNGDTATDKENIGPISYYPKRGFPAYYFPMTNVRGYQTPVVAIEFQRPASIVISIECTLWAYNIDVDREKGIGFTRIHLLIDV